MRSRCLKAVKWSSMVLCEVKIFQNTTAFMNATCDCWPKGVIVEKRQVGLKKVILWFIINNFLMNHFTKKEGWSRKYLKEKVLLWSLNLQTKQGSKYDTLTLTFHLNLSLREKQECVVFKHPLYCSRKWSMVSSYFLLHFKRIPLLCSTICIK